MPEGDRPAPIRVPGGGPLAGVTVLVTRAIDQAPVLADPLAALGARVVLTPAIRFAEPADWGPADAALRAAGSYDWAIFTSVNGVDAVGRRLAVLGIGWEIFAACRLVAIGPATAEALGRRGLTVEVVPEVYQAEGILDAIGSEAVRGAKILLARAARAREILPEVLRERGARVDVVVVYRTEACAPAPDAIAALARADAEHPTVVTFTSSSTVSHFVPRLPDDAARGLRGAIIAAIGPVTAEELRRRGLEPAIQPRDSTIPALVEAIRTRFA